MAWFSKDDYVRTPYRRRRAANYRTLVTGLLLAFCLLIVALLAVLVLMPMRRPLPDPKSWELALIDESAPLAEDFSVTVLALPDDYTNQTVYFDARAYDALCKMLADSKELGYTPIVTRGYESADDARQRFYDEQGRLRASGFSAAESYELALKAVPLPNLNEYRLGLNVQLSCSEDVVEFSQSQLYAWLCDHAREYGFVQWGEDADLWRYVGADNARQMEKRQLDLEGYLAYIKAELAEEEARQNRRK